MEGLRVQHQIRQQAAALQDTASDLLRWEKSIKSRDQDLKGTKKENSKPAQQQVPPIRQAAAQGTPEDRRRQSAADHTYDKGYKKWDKFDVDRALEQVDGVVEEITEAAPTQSQARTAPETAVLSPAMIVDPLAGKDAVMPEIVAAFPDAKPTVVRPRDVVERERGNDYFKQGDMEQAIKFYTRAIGFNPRSAVAYSNRAMAFLKQNDFASAEADCCAALSIEPEHAKSYMRRGTARNGLGRHRAAFLDFVRAKQLDPNDKQSAAMIIKTRELIKSCVRKAPRKEIKIAYLAPDAPEQQKTSATATGHIAPRQESPAPKGAGATSETCAKNPLPVAHETRESENVAVPQPKPSPVTQPAKIAKRIPSLEEVPKTLYDFERLWKELQSEPALRTELVVGRLGGQGVKSLFARAAPEADTFMEIVRAVEPASDIAGAAGVLNSLAAINGIDMTMMFLSKADKSALKSVLSNLQKRGAELGRRTLDVYKN